MAVFYPFVNLNVWLNRRQLESHICSESSPLSHMPWSLWKTPLYTVEQEWKMQTTLRKVLLTSQIPPKRLRNPQGFLDHTLRTAALVYSHLSILQMRTLRSWVGQCVSQVSQLAGSVDGGPDPQLSPLAPGSLPRMMFICCLIILMQSKCPDI